MKKDIKNKLRKKLINEMRIVEITDEDMTTVSDVTSKQALEIKTLGSFIGHNSKFVPNEDGSADKYFFTVYLDLGKRGNGKVNILAYNQYKSTNLDEIKYLGNIMFKVDKTQLSDTNQIVNLEQLSVFIKRHSGLILVENSADLDVNEIANEWTTKSGKILPIEKLVNAYINIHNKMTKAGVK